MDIRNIVIDRVVRGIALSTTDESTLFGINQITDPSLSCTSENSQAVDAIGVPIQTFYRAKTATFTAANALLDLDLAAQQFGSTKEVATSDKKVITPKFETIDIEDGMTSVTLAHIPIDDVEYIHVLNGDSSLGVKYSKGSTATSDKFVFDAATGIITLPTNVKVGDQVFVRYEYESETANKVTNSANKFPTACKFVMQILCCDTCDPTLLRSAYLVFPNAKLSPDVDLSFTTDGTHNFTFEAQQDYCSKNKELFYIVIDDEE